jgi:heat shock protein 1/8
MAPSAATRSSTSPSNPLQRALRKKQASLAVCPAGDKTDTRAETRLRLALEEYAKHTFSASVRAATCAVESLKENLKESLYCTGTVNRLRFDIEARGVYATVVSVASALLAGAGADWLHVDEFMYAGSTVYLPGLQETLAAKYADGTHTPFSAGTITGGGTGDPMTGVARGCVLQVGLLVQLNDPVVKDAFALASARGRTRGGLDARSTVSGRGRRERVGSRGARGDSAAGAPRA